MSKATKPTNTPQVDTPSVEAPKMEVTKTKSKTNPTPDEAGASNEMPDAQMAGVNPADYGYRANAKVEIPANLMSYLSKFLSGIIMKEQEVRFITMEGQEQLSEPKPQVSVSLLGKEAEDIINYLTELHVANIKSGKAVSMEILEKEREEGPKEPMKLS